MGRSKSKDVQESTDNKVDKKKKGRQIDRRTYRGQRPNIKIPPKD